MVTAPPNHPRFPSVEQETLSVEAALSWYIDDYPGEADYQSTRWPQAPLGCGLNPHLNSAFGTSRSAR